KTYTNLHLRLNIQKVKKTSMDPIREKLTETTLWNQLGSELTGRI
uniref:Uncharacterized protein n=1 Tax=Aegilops tauschii subsp. strangulata TaxID=200361 RepID=A0A453PN42_AEGTS